MRLSIAIADADPTRTPRSFRRAAGVVSAIADTACGYAALSLTAAGFEVLSVEFKINLLRPASGERLVAVGQVLRPGRMLSVTRVEVFADSNGESRMIAAMQATMTTVSAS